MGRAYRRYLRNTLAGWLHLGSSGSSHTLMKAVWTRLTDFGAPAHRKALRWLRQNELSSGGIRVHSCHRAAYPEVTGYLIPTMLSYNESDLAVRCAEWLIRIQAPDGSFPDPDEGLPYIFDTGQALRGLLAMIERVPGSREAARRAAAFLCSKTISGGREGFDMTPPPNARPDTAYPDTWPLSTHLYVLPPLRQAAAILNEQRYRTVADACLDYYSTLPDALQVSTRTHELGYELEAMIDLGLPEVAKPILNELASLQGEDGALRGIGGKRWICSPGLAQIAVCWYKTGNREAADRAIAWLEKHQLGSGGFWGSYGPGADYFPDVVPVWAVKFYLDAALHRGHSRVSAND